LSTCSLPGQVTEELRCHGRAGGERSWTLIRCLPVILRLRRPDRGRRWRPRPPPHICSVWSAASIAARKIELVRCWENGWEIDLRSRVRVGAFGPSSSQRSLMRFLRVCVRAPFISRGRGVAGGAG
jgi:hypothetical protein